MSIKTYVDGNGLFEEIGEMFKIRKKKNSVLDFIRYKQLNWYGHVRRMNEANIYFGEAGDSGSLEAPHK